MGVNSREGRSEVLKEDILHAHGYIKSLGSLEGRGTGTQLIVRQVRGLSVIARIQPITKKATNPP